MADSAPLTFSHREAVLLTNVSDETLHSWVKRGYIEPAVASTGRGKRRAYGQLNLVQIQVLRTFSDAGLDPRLSALIFERLEPLALELINRFADEEVPSTPSIDPDAPLDRTYRIWLIDRRGVARAELLENADGSLRASLPMTHLPAMAMWLRVDVLLNDWVMFPLEYDAAGRPQSLEAYEAWLDARCEALPRDTQP